LNDFFGVVSIMVWDDFFKFFLENFKSFIKMDKNKCPISTFPKKVLRNLLIFLPKGMDERRWKEEYLKFA
jgi:hypothetical protein